VWRACLRPEPRKEDNAYDGQWPRPERARALPLTTNLPPPKNLLLPKNLPDRMESPMRQRIGTDDQRGFFHVAERICVSCVGDGTNPKSGKPCKRCAGTKVDPDPTAPRRGTLLITYHCDRRIVL
jgi:hypothetical protein